MYWMLSMAHHSKRETNRKKAIASVTSIKDNANRNISHSGTCSGLKRKWTPIASDRDIAQLVRIAPRFRSERAWNPASHWAKKAKNRRAKTSRTEGSLARGKSTARRFFAVSPRLVKPVVWFAGAVVNWRSRSIAKSAYICPPTNSTLCKADATTEQLLHFRSHTVLHKSHKQVNNTNWWRWPTLRNNDTWFPGFNHIPVPESEAEWT